MRRRRAAGRKGALGTRLGAVTSDDIRASLAKSARIVFQLAPAEKVEIQETASGFGMTTTEYLLQVHRLFRKLTGVKRRRAS